MTDQLRQRCAVNRKRERDEERGNHHERKAGEEL